MEGPGPKETDCQRGQNIEAAHISAQLLGAQEVCEAPTEQKWGQTGGVTNVNTLKSLEGLQEEAASDSSHIS